MLRESKVRAVNPAGPDLGFLTNQQAWTSPEPAMNQSEAI